VASYEHVAMIKMHYSIADVLDECVVLLENGNKNVAVRRRACLTIPGCRILPKAEKHDDPAKVSPPSFLSFVLGSEATREQQDTFSSRTTDSKEDEYTREWIDME
jgi:hypothetical protein